MSIGFWSFYSMEKGLIDEEFYGSFYIEGIL